MQSIRFWLSFVFIALYLSLFGQAKIPFSALAGDNEGIFGVGMGLILPNELCSPAVPPYYTNAEIKSADQQNTYPGYVSAGHLRNDILGGVSGFPQFIATLAAQNLEITNIHMRFTTMFQDMGNWQFINGVDTRMYTEGQFELVYIDGPNTEVILSGNMPRLRNIVNYNNFGNCFDDEIYGDTEYFIPTNASQNSSAPIQALAAALIADISVEGIKIQYHSIQPAVVGFWSVGAVYSIDSGVIIKGKAPMMDLAFEFGSFGLNNNCLNAIDVISTGSGNWLELRDGSGGLIAAILDSEPMGIISTSFYTNSGTLRESSGGIELLDKNIDITPQVQPSEGAILVRLLFSTFDWNQLVGSNDGDGNDPYTFDDLSISKFNAICSANFGENGLLVTLDDWGKTGEGAAGGYFIDFYVSSFSSFFIHGPATAPLPVELTYFSTSYSPHSVQLEWETASEVNNKGFEVEKSTDGKTFEKIGWINAKDGDHDPTRRYAYTDLAVAYNKTYYYRLKQIDHDGTYSFSPIRVQQTASSGKNKLQCYPNPANDRVTVAFDSREPILSLIIHDHLGKAIKSQLLENGIAQLNLSTFPAGFYFLSVLDAHGQILDMTRLIKQE